MLVDMNHGVQSNPVLAVSDFEPRWHVIQLWFGSIQKEGNFKAPPLCLHSAVKNSCLVTFLRNDAAL